MFKDMVTSVLNKNFKIFYILDYFFVTKVSPWDTPHILPICYDTTQTGGGCCNMAVDQEKAYKHPNISMKDKHYIMISILFITHICYAKGLHTGSKENAKANIMIFTF